MEHLIPPHTLAGVLSLRLTSVPLTVTQGPLAWKTCPPLAPLLRRSKELHAAVWVKPGVFTTKLVYE